MRSLSAPSLVALFLFTLSGTVGVRSAHADTLNGTSVYGTLQVDSASGAQVIQQLNSPITVGAGVMQVGSFSALYGMETFGFSASFSDTGLQLKVSSPQDYANYTAFDNSLYSVVFTDTAFTGSFSAPNFSCSVDPYGLCSYFGSGLVSSSLNNGTLTLGFKNAVVGQVYDFSYSDLGTAVTPEPASLMLAGTAMLGMMGAARRRFSRQA